MLSLSASHPFYGSSESISLVFDQERQSRRTLPGASVIPLFVRMHGLILTGVGQHDFDTVHTRFLEELDQNYKAVKHHGVSSCGLFPRLSERLDLDICWIMMAIVNMTAVMQYGAEDAVIKKAIAAGKEKSSKCKAADADSVRQNKDSTGLSSKAAIIPPIVQADARLSAMRLSSSVEDETGSGLSEMAGLTLSDVRTDAHNLTSLSNVELDEEVQVPPVLDLSLGLMFSMLKDSCEHLWRPQGGDPAFSPYLTAVLTFIGSVSQSTSALAVIESYIPWEELVQLFNTIPASARSNLEKPSNRLFGTPLPEDWCIRGMDWTGRQLFGRGYWKAKFATGAVYQSDGLNAHLIPEGEADVLAEVYESPSMPPHAGGPAEVNAAVIDSDDALSSRETVAMLRWKRLALMAAWLIKAGSGLHLNEETGRIEIDQQLRSKINSWQASARGAKADQKDGHGSASVFKTNGVSNGDSEDDMDANR